MMGIEDQDIIPLCMQATIHVIYVSGKSSTSYISLLHLKTDDYHNHCPTGVTGVSSSAIVMSDPHHKPMNPDKFVSPDSRKNQ